MDFNKKLQELRKQKGMTQEELAEALFVSRAAISKWESGRGYPSIDSLQAIAKYFSVSVDQLLSTDEALELGKEEGKAKEKNFRDQIFGLIDISVALFFFLPFFAQEKDGIISEVSLLGLNNVQPYINIAFLVSIIAVFICGVLILAFKHCQIGFWNKSKHVISLTLSSVSVMLFIVSRQPYAAAFTFVLLVIKAITLIKKP